MKEPVMDWRDIMSWRHEVAALYRPVCEAVEPSAVWMAFVTARRELIHKHASAMSVADKNELQNWLKDTVKGNAFVVTILE